MTKYLTFTISALIALCPQNITIQTKASVQLPIPNVESNTSRLANPSLLVTANNNAM
jgi:hypothetical protein